VQKCYRIKRKNIIFIGSEMHYDSFWFKMMFMALGYATGKGGGPIRSAELTIIAYVNEGYTYAEKLPLDSLHKKYGHTVIQLTSSAGIVAAMNDLPVTQEGNCTVQVKLQDVIFFCHGLPSKITLNYEGSSEVNLGIASLKDIRSDAFVEDGAIWSYACRTGNLSNSEFFLNDAQAQPENSLAQLMANRFKIIVHAFITRSFYRYVLRDPSQSDDIAKKLKSERVGHETEVINLSDEHEALPHKGLAEIGGGIFWDSGPVGEGTNGFALWRKDGARVMPVSHHTPTGLTQKMVEFKPQ